MARRAGRRRPPPARSATCSGLAPSRSQRPCLAAQQRCCPGFVRCSCRRSSRRACRRAPGRARSRIPRKPLHPIPVEVHLEASIAPYRRLFGRHVEREIGSTERRHDLRAGRAATGSAEHPLTYQRLYREPHRDGTACSLTSEMQVDGPARAFAASAGRRAARRARAPTAFGRAGVPWSQALCRSNAAFFKAIPSRLPGPAPR
jgi:hypothetical protein